MNEAAAGGGLRMAWFVEFLSSALCLPFSTLQRGKLMHACYLINVHEITRAPPGEMSFRNACCFSALR